MRVVLDASVLLKWLLRDPRREPDTERASALVQAVAAGDLIILQPLHWLAEVAAVLTRLNPATAADDVLRVQAMELPSTDDPQVWRRACRLSVQSGQHVFDTLYHAVALEHGHELISADERYLRAARRFGRIRRLADWTEPA